MSVPIHLLEADDTIRCGVRTEDFSSMIEDVTCNECLKPVDVIISGAVRIKMGISNG
jgi:hypothetical protein